MSCDFMKEESKHRTAQEGRADSIYYGGISTYCTPLSSMEHISMKGNEFTFRDQNRPINLISQEPCYCSP